MDESTFISTDQTERELIWAALSEYRAMSVDSKTIEKVSKMIERVANTFVWVRDSDY